MKARDWIIGILCFIAGAILTFLLMAGLSYFVGFSPIAGTTFVTGGLSFSTPAITPPWIEEEKTFNGHGGLKVDTGGTGLRPIVLSRGRETERIRPPASIVWTQFAVSPDSNHVFMVAQQTAGGGGFSAESIVRLTLPSQDEPLANYTLTNFLTRTELQAKYPSGWLMNLDGVSSNGDRLLLRLSYQGTNRTVGSTTYYSYKQGPFYYYPKEKRFEEIKP